MFPYIDISVWLALFCRIFRCVIKCIWAILI